MWMTTLQTLVKNVTYLLWLFSVHVCMPMATPIYAESYTEFENYGVEPLQSLEMETSTTSQATINTNTLYTVMGSAFSMQNNGCMETAK